MRSRRVNQALIQFEGRQSSLCAISIGFIQKFVFRLQVEIHCIVGRYLLPRALRRRVRSRCGQSRSRSCQMQGNRRDKGKEHERFSPETLILRFGYSVSTFQMPWEESALLGKE